MMYKLILDIYFQGLLGPCYLLLVINDDYIEGPVE